MGKFWKFLKWSIVGLVGLFIFILTVLVLAIPIAKRSEKVINDPGVKLAKWVLTGGNIIDTKTGALLSSQSVFINYGVIDKIVPDSLAEYSEYHQIDMKGKYVVPGLIDMHAHVFDRSDLTQYLSYGVTTIRNMMGFPMHLRWKQQLAEGQFSGSRLITAGPTLNNNGQGGPFHKGISSAEEAKLAIQSFKAKGYDFIKIYDGVTSDQMAGIMAVAGELNMYVAGHPPRSLSVQELALSGIRSVEHVEELFQGLMDYEFDEIGARKIAKEFAMKDVKVCVTLSAYHQIYLAVVEKQPFLDKELTKPINSFIKFIGKKQMAEFPTYSKEGYDWTVKKYEFMERLVQILDEEGVTLLFGTDTGPSLTEPGKTVHEEMVLLKKCGLSNSKILKSATIDAAENLGMSNVTGSIDVGKRAEFLITQLNPLEDLTTLSSPLAISQGIHYYDQQAIRDLREIGENKQGWYITLGNFLEHLLMK